MSDRQEIVIDQIGNELTVIVEEIAHVESAAYELAIPGGIVNDAEPYIGSSLILAELSSRGAGEYDSKALSDAFDGIGVRHSEAGGSDRFTYRGSLLGDQLEEALRLAALMVRQPRLPSGEIESIRSVFLQDLKALVDNPAQRSLVELAKRYYPAPYNRPGLGSEEGLKACSAAQQRLDWERRFGPRGSVLSVAGKCRPARVLELARRLFGDWAGTSEDLPKFGRLPGHATHHIQFDSAQLQIALAYPSAPFGHECYYPAKVAVGVLAGGMFGRLFTEVREKRGLCYSVYARHTATKDYGTIVAYAGTVPQRARQTLEVMVQELKGLRGTVTAEELARSKATIKSSLVIGEESSAARASSNANDWWLDRKVRTLDQVIAEVDAVDVSRIDECLAQYPADSYMLLTLGAKDLHE